jgi:WD40 repeat protein
MKEDMKVKIILIFIVLFCQSCGMSTPMSNTTADMPEATRIMNTQSYTPYISLPSHTPRKETLINRPSSTNTMIKFNSIPSGDYLIYIDRNRSKRIYEMISINGKEMGEINQRVNGTIALSRNNTNLAYASQSGVGIYNLLDDSIYVVSNISDCYYGLSWGPSDELLAIGCGYKIKIIDAKGGELIGAISNPTHPEGYNNYIGAEWSPNGKWIAYYNKAVDMDYYHIGLYVSESACMMNENSCPWKSKLITEDYDYSIAWTPNSQLAVLDTREKVIRVYDVEKNAISQTITFPDRGYSIDSFTWSPEEDWIAISGGFGNGIYIVSIETMEAKEIRSGGAVILWLTVP